MITSKKKTRAQSMVEFALILPVLMMVLFGVMEFGRLLVIFVTVTSASREAARYGSAVGTSPSGLPRYQDCAGIRAAAQRVGLLARLTDPDIQITYDDGPNGVNKGMCPVGGIGPREITLGDRVVVQVNGHFEPIIPQVVPIWLRDVISVSARTVVKEVAVGTVPPPPPPPPVVLVFNDVNTITINEGDSAYTEIRIDIRTDPIAGSPVAMTNVIIPISLTGTAEESVDYTVLNNPVIMMLGTDHAQLIIRVQGDILYEYDETIIMQMTTLDPSVALIGSPSTFFVTIANDDPLPLVSFTSSSQSVPETVGTTPVVVTLNTMAGVDVTVPYQVTNSTAQDGGIDYHSLPGTIIIPQGFLQATIDVSIINDAIDEFDETIELTLNASPTNALRISPYIHTITIVDDDPLSIVSFVPETVRTSEGYTGTLEARLDRISGKDIVVNYSLRDSPTAQIGVDYNITPSPVLIPAGEIAGEIVLDALLDDVIEPVEAITVTMTTVQNALVNNVESYITIGPLTKPDVYFVTEYQEALEDGLGMGARLLLDIKLTGYWTQPVTVPFYLSGTATNNVDYVVYPIPVVIPARSLKTTLRFDITPDLIDEDHETIVVTMGTPVNANRGEPYIHTIRIVDDDPPPVVNFTQATQAVDEHAGTVQALLELSRASAKPVTIQLQLGGTAVAGSDYFTPTTTVTFAPGDLLAQVPVTIIDDSIYEGLAAETIILTIVDPPGNATRGPNYTHTIQIRENDMEPLNCAHFSMSGLTSPSNKRLQTVITNSSPIYSATLIEVTLNWSGANLTDIYFGGDPQSGVQIWSGSVSAPFLRVLSANFLGTENDRLLPASSQKYLTLQFQSSNLGSLTLTIRLNNGCNPISVSR